MTEAEVEAQAQAPEAPRAEAQEKPDVPCKACQIEPGDTDGTRDGGPA
ncbi:hypothetical protein YWIDRAFT_04740 [Streptomyces sp. SceaMP-e96]|nr:hypothetical protein YWIDRAFT_04740 [Streptomyces sp. SceaMP-e96]